MTLAEIATITHHDEELAKLDAKPRDLLVAADLAYSAGLADDKKWPAARAAYESALAAPGVGALEGYARFRLARVLFFQADIAAIAELEKVIALGATTARAPRDLADRARRELVALHARLGDVTQTSARLRALSPEGAAGEPAAISMLAEVAREALRVGEFGRAEKLFTELVARAGATEAGCLYAVGKVEAQIAPREDPSRELDWIRQLFDVQRELRVSSVSVDVERACGAAVARLAVDVAIRWHIQFAGARGERGSGDPRLFRLTADLYELLLGRFSAEQLDRMPSTGAASARPTALRLKHALADLYYYAKDWKRAAPAYDEVLALGPDAPDAAEVIYRAASTRLHEIYGWRPAPPPIEPGPEIEPSPEDAARLEADNRLICLGEPPRSSVELYDAWVDAKVDRGLVSLGLRRWADAARDLREVAFQYPDHVGAGRAGLLYLKILALQADATPTCGPELRRGAAALFELHCPTFDEEHNDWRRGGLALRGVEKAETCDALREVAPTAVPPAVRPELPPLPAAAPTVVSRGGDSTSVSGRIPIEVHEHIIERSLGGALGCYEEGLRANPELEGQLRASFVIGRDGSVRKVEVRASDALESSKVSTCIERWFYGLAFPQPEGGVVKLEFPLALTRTLLIPPQPEDPPTMTMSLDD